MLCAHKFDGLTSLPHTNSTHFPFPNVPLGCDKKHRGLGHSQSKFSRQEIEHSHIVQPPTQGLAMHSKQRQISSGTKQNITGIGRR